MDILNTKIKNILTEKNTKIIPENIKSGVNILGINGNVTELNGETKTVTPTTSSQTITPTGTGKNALTQVTVNAVTSAIDNNIQAGNIKKDVNILGVTGTYEGIDTSDANAVANDIVTGKTAYVNGQKLTGTYTGIIPTGTKSITQNGTVDVTNYASANVNVPIPSPTLQSKSVTITENGTQTITPDSGYDGLDEVEVTTNVSGSGGDITHEEYLEDVELARSILEDFIPYIELEYVKSTGTQYFNTDYYPNQNTKIIMEMETMGMASGQTQFNAFGTTDDTTGSASRFGWWTYFSGTSYFRYGVQSASRDSKINVSGDFINTKFTVSLDNSKAIIETQSQTLEYDVPTTDDFTLRYSLVLGGSKWDNGANLGNCGANYKLYSCKIYENDVLIHDWIPVINKLNNIVCLYDKINESFLYNSGTGSMIAGGVE